MTPKTFIEKHKIGATYSCMDPGSHKEPSYWKVHLTRDGTDIGSFDFHHGAAYRKYSARTAPNVLRGAGVQAGQQVTPFCRRNADALQALEESVPMEPELESVIFCLTADCQAAEEHLDFWDMCESFGMEPTREEYANYQMMIQNTVRLRRHLPYHDLLNVREDDDD